MTEVVIKVIGNYSYQTSKCLGEGVYGKVYQGMERQTKQKVAIKKIDLATFTNDKYLQNAIFSQIYLLKRFNHPNIVKFKDVLSSKNSLYIITEFCKNGDLKELIKRKKFKEEQSFEIMYQIMNGFSELIREKIVHRDLKPANILISQGTYKIGDFGFAKYVDNFGSQMLKSCVGSPIYMAPQILQRAQYTTKCDIWSLGVIFYEMLFGYPPWKARDEAQLLRGIKTIPIAHILKRNSNNLSSKALQFLKRTLAYGQEERIGWGQLFELFNQKPQSKSMQKMEQMFQGHSKQRNRMVSNGSTSWNQSISSKEQNQSTNNISSKNTNNSPMTPTNSGSNNKYSQGVQNQSGNMKNISSGGMIVSSPNISGTNNSERRSNGCTSQQQMDNVVIWRQFCAYYHFYTVELYTNLQVVRHHLGNIDAYGQLLLVLSLMVKYKSTYCLSLIGIHHKGNKGLEELYKKMKSEHDSYEMIYTEISAQLDAENVGRNVRNEIYTQIGRSEVINEEKNDKIENIMVKYANENAQILSDEVRKKAKTLKEIKIVEILNYILEVLSLGMGKQKALKQLKDSPRMEEENLKDYIIRVISKLDRLTMST